MWVMRNQVDGGKWENVVDCKKREIMICGRLENPGDGFGNNVDLNQKNDSGHVEMTWLVCDNDN